MIVGIDERSADNKASGGARRDKAYLLGIDQGTSGSRALILDREGQPCGYGYQALPRLYPQPGWVEQDVHEVTAGVFEAIAEALDQAGIEPDEIAAVGIDCQRNTDFVWDKDSGQALGNAITWQDLRTKDMMTAIEAWPLSNEIRSRLGRSSGAYSSALHLAWRMQNDPAIRRAAEQKRLQVGFSAAWLLRAMGKPNGHAMDYSLVQATGMYDFRQEEYWAEWLELLGVPRSALPEARPSLADYGVLLVASRSGATSQAPVLAMIGDQQAALFGYDCRRVGDAECTHGTASFINVFTGDSAPEHQYLNVYYAWHLGGIAWQPGAQAKYGPAFCLEADTTVTGAALRWMRENAHLLAQEKDVDLLAESVADSGGVMFVPAFTGLNVPYGDPRARGSLLGLTLGSSRAHIARAFLDSIGYQLRAILERIRLDTGLAVDRLHVGGGISASDLACQIQANWLGIPVIRPEFTQTSARAAALLAGLGAGFWDCLDELPALPGGRQEFEPQVSPQVSLEGYQRWQRAVQAVQMWAAGEAGQP